MLVVLLGRTSEWWGTIAAVDMAMVLIHVSTFERGRIVTCGLMLMTYFLLTNPRPAVVVNLTNNNRVVTVPGVCAGAVAFLRFGAGNRVKPWAGDAAGGIASVAI